MSLYAQAAELLRYIAPEFYKKRFFKKLNGLNPHNLFERNVEPELLWLRTILNKDSVFLDIGANMRAYIYLASDIVRPGNIHAFEPNQKLYKRLRQIFPGIHIWPLALSDKSEMAQLKIPIIQGKKVASRGTLQTNFIEKGEQSAQTQSVTITKADDWAREHHISKIDFIKIDVEGHEDKTLAGAGDIIKKFRPILMVEMEQRHHSEPLQQLVTSVENQGYTAHFLSREDLQLKVLRPEILARQQTVPEMDKKNYINNIIFIPKPL